jgi:hypothetical protein
MSSRLHLADTLIDGQSYDDVGQLPTDIAEVLGQPRNARYTALRHIDALIGQGILVRGAQGGRSTRYALHDRLRG